jgi:hypothetical protein
MHRPSAGSSTSCTNGFPRSADREFVALLLDTLRIDRPSYQRLHAYIASQGWPQWS